jgi:hypothetical protein
MFLPVKSCQTLRNVVCQTARYSTKYASKTVILGALLPLCIYLTEYSSAMRSFPIWMIFFSHRNVKLPSVCTFARPKLLPFYKHSKNIDCLPHNQVGVCFNLWYSKLKEYWSQSQKIWLWQILAAKTEWLVAMCWPSGFHPQVVTMLCTKWKATWHSSGEHRLNSQPHIWFLTFLLSRVWRLTCYLTFLGLFLILK